jgi:DNA-binding NtrC family response regulator
MGFTAPRPKARPEGSMSRSEQPPAVTDRPVMLLVEDDEIFRAVAGTYFRQAGFDVISAGNALDALDAAEKLTILHCVVIDIRLPKGTPHGVSLAGMISMRFPRAVRIFVTGDEDAKNYVTASDGVVFTKPIDLDAVAENIRTLLASATE